MGIAVKSTCQTWFGRLAVTRRFAGGSGFVSGGAGLAAFLSGSPEAALVAPLSAPYLAFAARLTADKARYRRAVRPPDPDADLIQFLRHPRAVCINNLPYQ